MDGPSHRRADYKKGLAAQDGPVRRRLAAVELRKDARERQHGKRRKGAPSAGAAAAAAAAFASMQTEGEMKEGAQAAGAAGAAAAEAPFVMDAEEGRGGAASDNARQAVEALRLAAGQSARQLTMALRRVRELLTLDEPPAEEVVECGGVPLLTRALANPQVNVLTEREAVRRRGHG